MGQKNFDRTGGGGILFFSTIFERTIFLGVVWVEKNCDRTGGVLFFYFLGVVCILFFYFLGGSMGQKNFGRTGGILLFLPNFEHGSAFP